MADKLHKLRLVLPSKRFKKSYREALREFLKESTNPEHIRTEIENLDSYISRERNLAERKEYWLVRGSEYVGSAQIRLKPSGIVPSHVYYDIRPSRRKQGYGTKILSLALKKARVIGLRKIIITCEKNNLASRKIIERNGGILKKEATVPGRPSPILEYEVLVNSQR